MPSNSWNDFAHICLNSSLFPLDGRRNEKDGKSNNKLIASSLPKFQSLYCLLCTPTHTRQKRAALELRLNCRRPQQEHELFAPELLERTCSSVSLRQQRCHPSVAGHRTSSAGLNAFWVFLSQRAWKWLWQNMLQASRSKTARVLRRHPDSSYRRCKNNTPLTSLPATLSSCKRRAWSCFSKNPFLWNSWVSHCMTLTRASWGSGCWSTGSRSELQVFVEFIASQGKDWLMLLMLRDLPQTFRHLVGNFGNT